MSTRLVEVTFTAKPARIVSGTQRGQGATMDYLMVTGVHIDGGAPVKFKPPGYDQWALKDASSRDTTYSLTAGMASRLERFVTACYIGNRTGFDGFRFMNFLMGFTVRPTTNMRRAYEGQRVDVDQLQPRRPYAIAHGSSCQHGMIGLNFGSTLSVLGINSALAICPVQPLMKANGGNNLLEITGVRPAAQG